MTGKPFKINQIRASGTPEPGMRQDKKMTAAQLEKRSKSDMVIERLSKIEEYLSQLGPAVMQHQKDIQLVGLQTHVALALLEQIVGRDAVETMMEERAELFGMKVTKVKEKIDDEQSSSDESSEGGSSVPTDEEHEGA